MWGRGQSVFTAIFSKGAYLSFGPYGYMIIFRIGYVK